MAMLYTANKAHYIKLKKNVIEREREMKREGEREKDRVEGEEIRSE